MSHAALPMLFALFALPIGVHAADVPLPQRIAAAQATAQNATACVPAQPYYWEIGNGRRVLAAGQVGRDAPGPYTKMAYASASKWVYASYVAERRKGELTDQDIQFLHFESGYTRFHVCLSTDTVKSCQSRALNGFGQSDPATVGLFDYNGGHMEQHALLMGLGPLGNEGLAAAIRLGLHALGDDWQFSYSQPQLAGGGAGTAADYGRFLRGIVSGDLKMSALLGSHAVCTNPTTCKTAVKTPIPETESWHYAVGHWVEDDPKVGDGAFSSPGAFGFYPWIDAGKQYYGILARESHAGAGTSDGSERPAIDSVDCGRLIRAAWLSGEAQP